MKAQQWNFAIRDGGVTYVAKVEVDVGIVDELVSRRRGYSRSHRIPEHMAISANEAVRLLAWLGGQGSNFRDAETFFPGTKILVRTENGFMCALDEQSVWSRYICHEPGKIDISTYEHMNFAEPREEGE